MDWLWIGGEGPKDLPSWVYLHLLNKFKVPTEKLVNLRSVMKKGFINSKPVTFFRVFDPAKEQALRIKDFVYLDDHPELVLYEGYWEKDGERVYVEHKTGEKN